MKDWRDVVMEEGGGGGPAPTFINKFRTLSNERLGRSGGVEVRIQTGAGNYEDHFRFYWLVLAWMLLAYHAMAAIILLFHISVGTPYLWLPHIVGTSVISVAIGFAALVYRFILFPSPGYVSHSPVVLSPYESSVQPMPPGAA